MKFINTKLHGVLDYIVALLLITSPWIFFFYYEGIGAWLPITLGASTLVFSLLTNYELAIWRKIPMPTHLIIDFLTGCLLAASPWVLGFADIVFWPHLIIGISMIIVVSFSSSKSYKEQHIIGYPKQHKL